MGKKCKNESCYNDADCRHGFCVDECPHRHRIAAYHGTGGSPRSRKPHLGVEIEVEWTSDESRRRITNFRRLENDASLLGNGGETKLCAPFPRIARRAARTVDGLRERGGVVSGRCGLHVHLDMRGVPGERVDALMAFAERTQDEWFALVPVARRGGRYTQRIRRGTYDNNETGHTTWLNRRSHTVECRLHPGTLNAHKMRGWLSVMNALMVCTRDEAFTFPTTLEQWETMISQEARAYIRARRAGGGYLRTATRQGAREEVA